MTVCSTELPDCCAAGLKKGARLFLVITVIGPLTDSPKRCSDLHKPQALGRAMQSVRLIAYAAPSSCCGKQLYIDAEA